MEETGRITSSRFPWPLLCAALLLPTVLHAQEHKEAFRSGSAERLVHEFDFDERSKGNLENEPKYWTPLRMPGFPVFAGAGFDFQTGHHAAPSFRLDCAGRNTAYEYTGPETSVKPFMDYSIEGMIRTSQMRSSRACLSAHFLDKNGHVIPGSMVRSRFVGPPSEESEWTHVQLYLPHAPPRAKTIGLTAWVLQEATWRLGPYHPRHIPRVDVHARAWFDEIVVRSLPIAQITTSALGNVLGPQPGTQELHVVFAHLDVRGLSGVLQISSADGVEIERYPIQPTHSGDVRPTNVSVGHLPPGLFRALLVVNDGDTRILTRRLDFARIAADLPVRAGPSQRFGVVLDPDHRSDAETEYNLIRTLRVGAVKLPLWSGMDSDDDQAESNTALVRHLAQRGMTLTAMLVGRSVKSSYDSAPRSRRMRELLATDPSMWRDHLTAVAVPFADVISFWQLGMDGDHVRNDPELLKSAVRNLRDTMQRFLTVPRIALPVHEHNDSADPGIEIEHRTIELVSSRPPADPPSWGQDRRQPQRRRASVFVAPTPPSSYYRLPRLAAWARQIITAAHRDADVVYSPPPWGQRQTPYGLVTEPTEEYVILRTITSLLGGVMPGPRLKLSGGLQVLAFYRGDEAILAAWLPNSPMKGRVVPMQLGSAAYQTDLWGQTRPLTMDDRGRALTLVSPIPTFIQGGERWIVDLISSFELVPGAISTGSPGNRHAMELRYRPARQRAGTVTLTAPEGWKVTPRQFTLSPALRQVQSVSIELRRPHNLPAGITWLTAQVAFVDPPLELDIPLPITVAVDDLDVWADVTWDRERLVISQTVTNRSDTMLHLRGTAQVPGRERQYRPIAELRPGQTQTVTYRFRSAARLSGSVIRISLQELSDGPRTHSLELIVP